MMFCESDLLKLFKLLQRISRFLDWEQRSASSAWLGSARLGSAVARQPPRVLWWCKVLPCTGDVGAAAVISFTAPPVGERLHKPNIYLFFPFWIFFLGGARWVWVELSEINRVSSAPLSPYSPPFFCGTHSYEIIINGADANGAAEFASLKMTYYVSLPLFFFSLSTSSSLHLSLLCTFSFHLFSSRYFDLKCK